jgi:hypothetical protein
LLKNRLATARVPRSARAPAASGLAYMGKPPSVLSYHLLV